MGDDVYLSIREAAKASGLSVPLLRRRIAAGMLPTYCTQADVRSVLLREADVQALFQIRPTSATAEPRTSEEMTG